MTLQDGSRRPDVYAPRRIGAFSHGYSLFVRVLKFALPMAALVIIGILISRLSSGPQQKIAVLPQKEKTTPGMIELVGARYEGVDDEGRAYTVTADRATRAMNAPDAVSFVNPEADITLKDKSWVAAKAKTGFYDRKAETLVLADTVHVFHDSGYEMRLQDVKIDLRRKTAATDKPVSAQGPFGAISAQNLSVGDDGNLIVFGGPATLTLYNLSPKKARG